MQEPWVEKYKPRKLREIISQPEAIRAILEWADGWRKGKPKRRALLFYGQAGTGKTAAAEALSSEMGWDLIALNASDTRTFEVISRVAGTAATTGTLLEGAAGKRLVVLDEADNVHGVADRGGYKAIAELIESAQNPVVLVAIDRYAIPSNIREMCIEVGFRRLSQEAIVKELSRVCRAERIEVDPRVLNVIAENSRGDLRSAFNDLQAVASDRRRVSLGEVTLYLRDREASIFDVLRQLTQVSSCRQARELLWTLDRPPDDAIDWIDENIPRMLTDPADLVRAYAAISRADLFLSRARRRQAYRMWGYASDLMTAGVALSRRGKLKYVRFQAPSSGILYRRTSAARAVRDSLARKIAARCHVSSRDARGHFIPYFGIIFKRDRKTGERIAAELELGDAEVDYLAKAV